VLVGVAIWLSGIASAVLGGLLVEGAKSLLATPSLAAQLRTFVRQETREGRIAVADRRLELAGPGLWSRVVLMRDPGPRGSDHLFVLDEREGDLGVAFTFEPRASAPPPVSKVLKRTFPLRRKVVTNRLRLAGVADLSGDGNPDVLLVLDDGEPYLRYAFVLSYDTLHGYRLTPFVADHFQVGPPDKLTRPNALLMGALYQHPLRTISDSRRRVPSFRTRGADSFALILTEGRPYVAAGFVVSLGGRASETDTNCAVDAVIQHLHAGCVGSQVAIGVDRVNMKAWSFERQGVGVQPRFCGGDKAIVHVNGSEDSGALQAAWPRYIAQTRYC
jgi:hypothetical protein